MSWGLPWTSSINFLTVNSPKIEAMTMSLLFASKLPTNFFGTNPDALEKAFLSKGESLVQGLENLIRDLESNNGELLVRLADETAFKVGLDLAATPGKVVFSK